MQSNSASPAPNRDVSRHRLFTLVVVITVAGMSQGLLLPLLTLLLDRQGISSDMNGLNAAALYIGIFATMFYIERPVRRYGYKPVLIAGVVLVSAATLLFSATSSLAAWFVLRLLVGAGDSALHYTSQLWIVSGSPQQRRGRNIALYGMAYGLGFSLGPLGINLLKAGDAVPFVAAGLIFIAVMPLLLKLPNEFPDQQHKTAGQRGRFRAVYKLAWFALIPSLLYGLMESTMNSNFPIYGLRMGLSSEWISLLLPAVGIGSLVLQLPLGIWSDRAGRKRVLMISGMLGGIAFLCVPAAAGQPYVMLLLLAAAGGFVGSFFSLGLAYAADLLPKPILPAANVISSLQYSIGSIAGPAIGGLGLAYVALNSIFVLLGAAFLLFAASGMWFRSAAKP